MTGWKHWKQMSSVLTLALAIAATTSSAAFAQAGDVAPGRPNRAAGAAPSNAELATMLDAYAIVQAQKALELGEDQYGRFITRLRRLQETRRKNMQARNRLLQDLRRMLAPEATADEAGLRERLKTLRELDEQAALAMRREYESIDEVLDARQQARFRLFEERVERQKLDLLMRARERAARAGPQRRNDGGR